MTNFREARDFVKRLRGLYTIAFSNSVAAIISGIFFLVIANLLGIEDFGRISYLLALGYVTFALAFFGAKDHLMVFTAKEGKSQSTVYLFTIITGIIASIILFFIFYNPSLSLYVVGLMIFGLVTGELLGRSLYKDYMKILITQRILMVGLGIGLYYLMGINGILLGYALSMLPFSFKIISVFKKTRIDFSIIKSRSGFITHVYGNDLSRNLTTIADKLIIFPLYGYAFLGNYQLGAQIVILMSIIPISVYQFTLPKDTKGENTNRIKITTFFISIIIATLSIFLAPAVIPILFPDFTDAVQIIQIMSFSIIPISANQMFSSTFLANGKSRIVFISAVVFIGIQFLGIWILGGLYGVNGAAISLVIGATSQTLCFLGAIQIYKGKKDNSK